jgi:hypothetical protein
LPCIAALSGPQQAQAGGAQRGIAVATVPHSAKPASAPDKTSAPFGQLYFFDPARRSEPEGASKFAFVIPGWRIILAWDEIQA